jgi:hypothetical protein
LAGYRGENPVLEEYCFIQVLRETEDMEVQGRRPKTSNQRPAYHANALLWPTAHSRDNAALTVG